MNEPAAVDPDGWDALDHAIYDAKIRKRLSWRQVGDEVGMTFSAARKRFYRAMAKVEVPEIQAMRQEENEKLDDREQRVRQIYAHAINGVPLMVKGEPLFTVINGRFVAAVERDLRTALAAVDAEGRIAVQRAKLNGLEAPIRVEIGGDVSVADEIEAAVMAYNLGRRDEAADAGDRTAR